MFFPWQKEQIKKSNRLNRDNKILIEELKKQGIAQSNILHAMEKVPRELFVKKNLSNKRTKIFPYQQIAGKQYPNLM